MKKLERIDTASLSRNPRANLAAWLRYEPIVTAAFHQHPKTYIYKPSNMSPATVCSRLRDAIRGRIAFEYVGKVDSQSLCKWFDEVIFKHDHENVYIGKPEDVKVALTGEQVTSDLARKLTFPTLSFEEVSAFTLLLSTRRIDGPVEIQVPPDLTLLPPRPNVEYMHREDGSLVLI